MNLTERSNPAQWEKLIHDTIHTGDQSDKLPTPGIPQPQQIVVPEWDEAGDKVAAQKVVQLQRRFIITPVKSGLLVIDQQRAHERILFEDFIRKFESNRVASQHLLFPENIHLSEPDADLLRDILPHVQSFGFTINPLGKNSFVVGAVPVEMVENENIQIAIEEILENFMLNLIDSKLDATTNMARSLARRLSVRHGKMLSDSEMMHIINALFACRIPDSTPAGKTVLTIIPVQDLVSRFK